MPERFAVNETSGEVILLEAFNILDVTNQTWWFVLTVWDYFPGPNPRLSATVNVTVIPTGGDFRFHRRGLGCGLMMTSPQIQTINRHW